MNITYIHHSCFLVETGRFYYLFDYERGNLPEMDARKPLFVLSSHSHGDHYNPEVFTLLKQAGMCHIRAVLSDDIEAPATIDTLSVSPGTEYDLGNQLKLTTFQSTDLGVAFLIEDQGLLIYHAGDLNDWQWEGEPEESNAAMHRMYLRELNLIADRHIDVAFVPLDARQEHLCFHGLAEFLEIVQNVNTVYPMHYWERTDLINQFVKDHPQYEGVVQNPEEL